MKISHLISILTGDKLCFPEEIIAVQGSPLRHTYMIATVALLRDLARPIRALEIGSWCGCSTISWARAMDKFLPAKGSLLCIDPWRPYFGEEDQKRDSNYQLMNNVAEFAYQLFLHNLRFAPPTVPIDHFRGMSTRNLSYLADRSFDLIYIDGSHYYDHVLSDINQAKRLIRDGGIICGDDLDLQIGQVDLEYTKLHSREDHIFEPKTKAKYHPGVTRAVGESFGDGVSSYEGYWLMRERTGRFARVDLSAQPTFIPDYLSHLLKWGNKKD